MPDDEFEELSADADTCALEPELLVGSGGVPALELEPLVEGAPNPALEFEELVGGAEIAALDSEELVSAVPTVVSVAASVLGAVAKLRFGTIITVTKRIIVI